MSVPECFEKSEQCRAAYICLIEFLRQFQDVVTEPKKQSAHFVAGRAAFLGAHPRRNGIRLNIVLDRQLSGDRIAKAEQVSKTRFHNEVDINSGSPIDSELADWISEAYNLQRVVAKP